MKIRAKKTPFHGYAAFYDGQRIRPGQVLHIPDDREIPPWAEKYVPEDETVVIEDKKPKAKDLNVLG